MPVPVSGRVTGLRIGVESGDAAQGQDGAIACRYHAKGGWGSAEELEKSRRLQNPRGPMGRAREAPCSCVQGLPALRPGGGLSFGSQRADPGGLGCWRCFGDCSRRAGRIYWRERRRGESWRLREFFFPCRDRHCGGWDDDSNADRGDDGWS